MKAIWESWPDWLTQGVIRCKLIREGVYISATAQRKVIIAESAEGL